jgi:hypothetical protein
VWYRTDIIIGETTIQNFLNSTNEFQAIFTKQIPKTTFFFGFFFFASILLISISIQLYFRLDRCRPPSPPFIRRGSLFRVFHDLVHNLAPSSAAVNSESVTMSNVCSKQKKGEGKKARLIQHNFYTRSFNASYLFIFFFYPLNKFSGLTEFESTQKSCSSCLAMILPCDVSVFLDG